MLPHVRTVQTQTRTHQHTQAHTHTMSGPASPLAAFIIPSLMGEICYCNIIAIYITTLGHEFVTLKNGCALDETK